MATRLDDGALRDDLVMPASSVWNRAWSITDANNNPLTVNGWSVRAQIRPPGVSTVVLFEWNTSGGMGLGMATAAGTTVTISLNGTNDSNLWTFTTGVYDVLLTNPSGQPTRIVEGLIRVIPSITH